MRPDYRIYEITEEDGFVFYAVVNRANRVGAGIVEKFYTRWDAEEFVAAETV